VKRSNHSAKTTICLVVHRYKNLCKLQKGFGGPCNDEQFEDLKSGGVCRTQQIAKTVYFEKKSLFSSCPGRTLGFNGLDKGLMHSAKHHSNLFSLKK
jgi:hypothetical protein